MEQPNQSERASELEWFPTRLKSQVCFRRQFLLGKHGYAICSLINETLVVGELYRKAGKQEFAKQNRTDTVIVERESNKHQLKRKQLLSQLEFVFFLASFNESRLIPRLCLPTRKKTKFAYHVQASP